MLLFGGGFICCMATVELMGLFGIKITEPAWWKVIMFSLLAAYNIWLHYRLK